MNHHRIQTIARLAALMLCILLLPVSCRPDAESPAQITQPEPSPDRVAETPAPTEAPADEPEETGKAVTILIYMTGSDLESGTAAATKDLAEMAESGIDLSRANVVVLTGGAQKWHSDVPEDANVVLELTEEGFRTVELWEQMSMGTPENLSRFLGYGYERYPAKTFDLILWDHGNGPVIGYCLDRQYENDTLTLPELKKALGDSPFSGQNRLGFIGFDACLMASAELVCTTAPFAEYLVASQETEPNFGWNYAFLKDAGQAETAELTRGIVDDYLAYCEAYYAEKAFFQSDVTLSVVDLEKAGALEAAIDALFQAAGQDVIGRYGNLAVSRVHARAFGRAGTGSEYDLIDLTDLSEQMRALYPAEAAAVAAAVEDAVVYAGANTPQSCGVSLYYPFYNKRRYDAEWKENYRAIGLFPSYQNYLNRYDRLWHGTDAPDAFSGALIPQEVSGKYTLELTDEQVAAFASGSYYILRRHGEAVYAAVCISDAVTLSGNTLTADFDGSVLYFESGSDCRDIPAVYLIDRIGSETIYQSAVCGIYRDSMMDSICNGGTQTLCRFWLAVDHETGAVTVRGFYPYDAEQDQVTGKQEELDPEEYGSILIPDLPHRYLERDEQGRVKPYLDWTPDDSFSAWEIFFSEGLTFSLQPLAADGSEYSLMFELMDVQGNRFCSELLPLTEGAGTAPGGVPGVEGSDDPEPEGTALYDDGSIAIYAGSVAQRETDYGTERTYGLRIVNRTGEDLALETEDVLLGEQAYRDAVTGSSYLRFDPSNYSFYFVAAANGVTDATLTFRLSADGQTQAPSFILRVLSRERDALLYRSRERITLP